MMIFYNLKKSTVLAALLLTSSAPLANANLRGVDSETAQEVATRELKMHMMHTPTPRHTPRHGHKEQQPRGQHRHGQQHTKAKEVDNMPKAKKLEHMPTPHHTPRHGHKEQQPRGQHHHDQQHTKAKEVDNMPKAKKLELKPKKYHHHHQTPPAKTEAEAATPHHEFSSRIVGGNDAAVGEFKFIASWDESCGGSLIAPNMVLTAAHCAAINGPLRIGSHLINSGGVSRSVATKCSHPNYNDVTTDNDYLILKLDQAVDTSKFPVVQLNSNANEPQDNEMLTVIGFGATSEGGNVSNRLQKVQVPANPQSVCAQQYPGVQPDIHLCAGFTSGGKDSCQGDSGGPIFEMQGSIPVQVGVVSFGDGCARPNKSGVYARVSGAYDWIQSTMKELDNGDTSNCLVDGGGGPTPVASPVEPPTSGNNPTSGNDNNSPTFNGSPSAFEGSPDSWPTWDDSSPTFNGSPSAFQGSPNSWPTWNGNSPTFNGSPSAFEDSPHSWPTWNGGGGENSHNSWWWNRKLRGSDAGESENEVAEAGAETPEEAEY